MPNVTADDDSPVPTTLLDSGREIVFARYRLIVDGSKPMSVEGSERELTVGTDESNDLVITDPRVSRHHFAVSPTERGHLIRDLGSKNGTRVNGVAIECAYLSPNAVIAIGGTRLRFEMTGDDEHAPLAAENHWGRALGSSPVMRRIFAILPRLAKSDATILLEGETGTGKGLVAEAIHEASLRSGGPFVVVDCGSIPPSLIESELFGHEKGAFTGASTTRIGAFETARGGTLFLDEVGELALDMQPKLLRALEERTIKRIGGTQSIKLDMRVIAATNRDLRAEINRGRFRSDVYYRLNTFRLRLPALRERREDIPLLVSHFWGQFASEGVMPPAEVIADFTRHDWPGNVRELRAAVERTVVLDDPSVWRELDVEAATTAEPAATPPAPFRVAKERAVAAWERDYLRALIERHGGNISRAAREVRMDRSHLRELLGKHRIRAEDN